MVNKKIVFTLAFTATFVLGYSFHSVISKPVANPHRIATGIGGIFFKCKDPKKVRDWYAEHLGLNINQYGTNFEWRQGADSTKKGYTLWAPFKESTTYFAPSTKDFMINFRVEHMDQLITQLKKDGVTVTDSIQTVSYGKFVHIMDIENNKIELWEPNDIEYEKLGDGKGVTK